MFIGQEYHVGRKYPRERAAAPGERRAERSAHAPGEGRCAYRRGTGKSLLPGRLYGDGCAARAGGSSGDDRGQWNLADAGI